MKLNKPNLIVTLVIFFAFNIIAAEKEIKFPAGTKAMSSFKTEKDKGADKLLDGDKATYMNAAGGTCRAPDQATSVFFRFSSPIENLGGVVTGSSCKFHNYFPQKMEFWVDSNNDGRFDTKVGSTNKLGAADKCIGKHKFVGRLPKAYGLEVKVVKQKVAGGQRAWTMNEMSLITDDSLPVLKATPNAHRVTYFKAKLPKGCTVKTSFKTDPGKGPELLIDGKDDTAYAAKQGTAKKGKTSSIFLRFPKPENDLSGLVIGRSDKWGNYQWQTMEIWADTTGNGKYDTKAGTFKGPKGGEKRFDKTVPKTYGLELRVTKQNIKGTRRAFVLSEIKELVFKDAMAESEMRYVVEDFEDFTSWRTWATNTNQPEGVRYWGGYTYICGVKDPAKAKDGQGVGIMRYCFKDNPKPKKMWSVRADAGQEGVIEKITFWANPQGKECDISFEIASANKMKTQTPKIKLSGNEWKQYSIDINPRTMPATRAMKYPYKIKLWWMETKTGGTGDILLDDLTIIGAVDRSKRIAVKRIYEGISFSPYKPVVAKYIIRNALDSAQQLPLKATLYRSLDMDRKNPVMSKTVDLNLKPYGQQEVAIDFGKLPQDHYYVDLTVNSPGIKTETTDLLAVTDMNGKRLNNKPMWFGAMHQGRWTSEPENIFVFDEAVVPMGLDCYRTGAPTERIVSRNLLAAAGFGGMPKELRLPKQKNDGRGAPTDYDKYYEWCKKQARERYLPRKDSIISIEFYNEPDLPNFCYLPDIDTFDKMHKVFAKAFREVIPGVKIGTGSNTVEHGKEKKDFNWRSYQEIAGSGQADVAVWHAHGSLSNYITRQRMVENWMKKGGVTDLKFKLGNSEAASGSRREPRSWLHQAVNLVKKVGWAKSQPSSLFYIWFMTTDLMDPQYPHGGDNWGLITIDKRLKASGHAYNELIKQLANTEPMGEVDLGKELQTCYYTKSDGSQVWLLWPTTEKASFIQPLSASGPITVCNMFGGEKHTLNPVAGKINLKVAGNPLYLNAVKGVKLSRPQASAYASYQKTIGVAPGKPAVVKMNIKNIWNKDVKLKLSLEDMQGTVKASETVELPKDQTVEKTLMMNLPEGIKFGSYGYIIKVSSDGAGLKDELLPLMIVVAEPVPKVAGPFTVDGSVDKLEKSCLIVLNKKEDTKDLVFDPNTPYWKDAEDLSVKLYMAHDTKNLYFCFDVKDQTHIPGEANGKLWAHDSVQIGLAIDGRQFEFGLTEKDGGFGWCWITPDVKLKGKMNTPVKVIRKDNNTTYEMAIPFEMLGVKYRPGMPARMTFLLNEDDGRNRVRIMKWYDGIASGKNVEKFGHLILE